jgi:hypothetical protein
VSWKARVNSFLYIQVYNKYDQVTEGDEGAPAAGDTSRSASSRSWFAAENVSLEKYNKQAVGTLSLEERPSSRNDLSRNTFAVWSKLYFASEIRSIRTRNLHHFRVAALRKRSCSRLRMR